LWDSQQPKSIKIWGKFQTTLQFDPEYLQSGTKKDVVKWKMTLQTAVFPAHCILNLVNFGPQAAKIRTNFVRRKSTTFILILSVTEAGNVM